ncbi:hypothetical protein, partial [Streptomyces sp. NPDC004324]
MSRVRCPAGGAPHAYRAPFPGWATDRTAYPCRRAADHRTRWAGIIQTLAFPFYDKNWDKSGSEKV